MATPWIEVVTNALTLIDDVRLSENLSTSPAQFFRRMSLYVNMALPLMSRPPELLTFLQTGLVQPSYADTEWVSTEESTTQETTVETGLADYEMVSCVIRELDNAGNVTLTPYTDFTYDSETGDVVFAEQETSGIDYILDFYTDGQFAGDLTATQLRLFGLGISCVWDERFSRNFLNMQMKIHDRTFDTVNESNYIKEVTERLLKNRAALNDELRKYEQDCAYAKRVSSKAPHTTVLL